VELLVKQSLNKSKIGYVKEKIKLQVGTLIFKFIETKARKIYEGKY